MPPFCNMRPEKIPDNLAALVPKEKLVVASSGGVDSQVLLHMLWKTGYTEVMCVYCDHGLRQDTSKDWDCVRASAKQYNFTARRLSLKKVLKTAENFENAAREARYKVLEEVRQQLGAAYILTAHHGDDLAESQLQHWVRGSGLYGMIGIREKDEKRHLLRPLLSWSKKDILRYAKAQGIAFHEDSTNQDQEISRNALRKRVMPSLRRLNPELTKTALTFSNLAEETTSFLTTCVEERMGNAVEKGRFSYKAFLALPPILQRHLLVLLQRRWGAGYTMSFIETLRWIMTNHFASGRHLYLTSGRKLSRSFDTISVGEEDNEPELQECIDIPQSRASKHLVLVALKPSMRVLRFKKKGDIWESWHTTVKKWRMEREISAHHAKNIVGVFDPEEKDIVAIMHPFWQYPEALPISKIPLPKLP